MFACAIRLIYICDTCTGTPMPFTCVPRLVHMYEMTCSCVWYASRTYAAHTMAHQCHSHVWHDWFKCIKRYVRMCNTPHLHMWHMYWHTNAIYMCDMTHSYVWNDMFICVICLTYICDTCNGTPMPFTYVTWHDSQTICSQASCASFTYVRLLKTIGLFCRIYSLL